MGRVKGGPHRLRTPAGWAPIDDLMRAGRRAGSKVPPAKRKAKRRQKGK